MLRALAVGVAAVFFPHLVYAQAAQARRVDQIACPTVAEDRIVRTVQTSEAFKESVRSVRRFHDQLSEASDSNDVSRFCGSLNVRALSVLGAIRFLGYYPALEQMATTYALLGVSETGKVHFLNARRDGAIQPGIDPIAWNAFLADGPDDRTLESPVEALEYGCQIHSLLTDGRPLDRCAAETRAEVARRGAGWEVTLSTLGQRVRFTDHGLLDTTLTNEKSME
jgi:hypothetical protein